ncbi:MAG: glycerate kinase [Candidatus Thorarchaeota archaeon]
MDFYIKNKSQLLSQKLSKNQIPLRKIGLEALEKAISAVKPENLMREAIKIHKRTLFVENDEFDLREFDKIYIIGGGKATAEMAWYLEKMLSKMKDLDYKGIINVPEMQKKELKFKYNKISINFTSHPIPNEAGLIGTKAMLQLIEQSSKKDLVICLISGGGSALLPLPKYNITLKDLQKINSLLLASGASINEINIIRKHISEFKGGNLAKKLYNSSKAKLITLIISDVMADDLGSIASGPTVPDITTFQDAFDILKKYKLLHKIPSSIKQHIEKGINEKDLETPKVDDICFTNVHNYLIGTVNYAVKEVRSFLSDKNFQFHYFSNEIKGEAKLFGINLYNTIYQYLTDNLNLINHKKIALVGTGELTVTIKGKGIGGRNQEMLLSFLNTIKDKKFDNNFLVIGANLDGIEGNSKAMGALVDNYSLELICSQKLNPEEFLLENDSNTFFNKLGCEIVTGPTGCNVNDLILILLSF